MRKIGEPRLTRTVCPAAATPRTTSAATGDAAQCVATAHRARSATPPMLAKTATQSTAVGPSDQLDHADEEHAAERRAREIGRVEPADAARKAGEHEADRRRR